MPDERFDVQEFSDPSLPSIYKTKAFIIHENITLDALLYIVSEGAYEQLLIKRHKEEDDE